MYIHIIIIINKCKFSNKTLFKKVYHRVFFTKMHYFLIDFYDSFFDEFFLRAILDEKVKQNIEKKLIFLEILQILYRMRLLNEAYLLYFYF